MNIWAIGKRNEAARVYVQSTSSAEVLLHVEDGEEIAPVTEEQRQEGVILLGNMQVKPNDIEG